MYGLNINKYNLGILRESNTNSNIQSIATLNSYFEYSLNANKMSSIQYILNPWCACTPEILYYVNTA